MIETAPEIADYVAALKQHGRKVVALALRQLLRLLREYPRESFLAAVREAGQYGLYDLDRRHIRSAEHLIHWTGRKGKAITALDEQMIEEFARHLNRCRCLRYGHTHRRDLRKGARLFLGYGRRAGVLMTPIAEETIADPALLVSFGRWMREQRGTCDATLYNYSVHLRDLLKSLGEDPGRFEAHNLRQFILDTSQRCGWASAKKCTMLVLLAQAGVQPMFSAIRWQVSMLRHGASLQEIAGVLRHRSIATTEIYAKVDVVSLRQIAQPWPEVKSC